jgi:glucose-6-phosphate 1-dehydrogenase
LCRAKASCTEYGGLDPAAFEKLSANLRYVNGDYKDPKTFERLKSELGKVTRQ